MNKLTIHPKLIQTSPIDSETHEIIELINGYPLPGDFFYWLSEGDFSQSNIEQKIVNEKYEKIGQLFIRDSLVFTGRVEMELKNFPKESIDFFMIRKKPFLSTSVEFSKFAIERKNNISSDLHYTLISDIIYNGIVIGVFWEIYELPRIIQIYNTLDDPLRYWRNS